MKYHNNTSGSLWDETTGSRWETPRGVCPECGSYYDSAEGWCVECHPSVEESEEEE